MKKYVINFLLLLGPLTMAGQDIHFSQYNYSPLNLSPSHSGLFDGDARAHAFYRNQWNSITTPYKTFGLAYDQVIGIPSAQGNRNAAGVVLNNDKAGDGNLGNLQLLLSYSRIFSVGSDSMHFFSAGVQGGFTYSSIDINKLSFDNQYNGESYNPLLPSGESFERTSFIYPDFNAGISWTTITEQSLWQLSASVQHIFRPEQKLISESYGLPRRYQFQAGTVLYKENSISVMPSIIYMMQHKFRELTGGAEIKFNLQKEGVRKKAFSLGLHYRVKDAVIPSAAIYFDQWRAGISYDVNTSDLQTVSNKRGGPELHLTYILKKVHYTKTKNICPVY